jgi:hypothetical protein|tara:strand:- start:502 stop:642 length:141 start_codon:yes stop_codon:yes gene_type:complete
MKHPSYSRASNQYAGRSKKKLTPEQKEAHRKEMKAFAERLKKLEKK